MSLFVMGPIMQMALNMKWDSLPGFLDPLGVLAEPYIGLDKNESDSTRKVGV